MKHSLLETAVKVAFFMLAGGLCWWIFNDFAVYSSEGFDPLRYEYYARFGLPNYFLDTTSYRIVGILAAIYSVLPYYWGYIIVITVLAIILRRIDASAYISLAIFSPISFYYLSQTGKDGIAILALIAAMILAFDYRKIGHIIFCISLIGLAIFVRPPILIYIPLVVLQTRFGTRVALLATLPLIVVFNYSIDLYSTTSSLDNLTDDMGAGSVAQLLRRYTLGYEIMPILAKATLFFLSLLFQPLIGVMKFISSGSYFVLFEAISFAVFLVIVIRGKILYRFMAVSLPYCIIIGATSPFYHFRYLAIAYPIIFIYAKYAVKAPASPAKLPSSEASIRILEERTPEQV